METLGRVFVTLGKKDEKRDNFVKKVVDTINSLWYSCHVVTERNTTVLRHDNSTITTAYLKIYEKTNIELIF